MTAPVATKQTLLEHNVGINFPIQWPTAKCHLYCAYNNRGRGNFYHRKEIIKTLWPSYEWHKWGERRLKSVCNYRWVTWMGPGNSGKSTDAAIFALERWIESPSDTAVIVCSTTMKMLRKRIWSEVSRWHQALPKGINAGELIDSDTMIRWKKGDAKHGIFGMAVEEGPIEEVINNLIGIHTESLVLVLDEMQGIREAIIRATDNMSKNPRFDFWGMGNPEGDDPLTRESTPINGWDSVERMVTPRWETLGGPMEENGCCEFFNGFDSPAITEPDGEKKFYYLLQQRHINGHLKRVNGNMNDPGFVSQCIGWPPFLGVESTVLDEQIVQKFKCTAKAVWTHGFKQGAALDPAFGGGDRKILQFFRFGEVQEEVQDTTPGVWNAAGSAVKTRWVIEMNEWLDVPIDVNSDEPVHYQIQKYVTASCKLKNILPEDFALDSSGEGGGLKAILDKEWGTVVGVEFGGNPSERVIEQGTERTAKEEYDTRSSELNMTVRRFAMANGLRGLSDKAKEQFCARKTTYRNKKTRVEPKTRRGKVGEKGFKDRLGYSPDHADAVAIACELALQRGAYPSPDGAAFSEQAVDKVMAQATSEEFAEENYLNEADYSLYL